MSALKIKNINLRHDMPPESHKLVKLSEKDKRYNLALVNTQISQLYNKIYLL